MWPKYLCCVWTYTFSLGNIQPENALAKIHTRIQEVRCVFIIICWWYCHCLCVYLTFMFILVYHPEALNSGCLFRARILPIILIFFLFFGGGESVSIMLPTLHARCSWFLCARSATSNFELNFSAH